VNEPRATKPQRARGEDEEGEEEDDESRSGKKGARACSTMYLKRERKVGPEKYSASTESFNQLQSVLPHVLTMGLWRGGGGLKN